MEGSAVIPMEVAMVAGDGERRLFVPTQNTGAVMLAATVTKRELSAWIPLGKDVEVLELNGELPRDRVSAWLEELCDNDTLLPDEKEVNIGTNDAKSKDMVLKHLRAYRKSTAGTDDWPPTTAFDIEHNIDTGEAAPIMMRRRQQAQTEDLVVESSANKILLAGIIEGANGTWGFSVVMVKKRMAKVRFCVDYRALNKVTSKDVYPLRRIDETLEAFGAENGKAKTAFLIKQGLYRFVQMPFGLCNAPSTFQRMMNTVYLDDIIVYTRGRIERHVVELACVLGRLVNADLTLKLKKCVFAVAKMEYLGHELGTDGVWPLQRLVTVVQNFPNPTDVVEVKRFVHLTGYYRRFIEGFGSLMAPMTKLLREDVRWEWTAQQDDASHA
ncbi:Retrovirus Polyprotein [Phytophthora megakarya]|uniref:Retrovirus Polyprotein n=1 Tax=Phytophthora megakarya TaxID=4795 RepID=A0A225UY38_9STRA|nr:Retrovirus Polyprotein [Phytophthora megakarya]